MAKGSDDSNGRPSLEEHVLSAADAAHILETLRQLEREYGRFDNPEYLSSIPRFADRLPPGTADARHSLGKRI